MWQGSPAARENRVFMAIAELGGGEHRGCAHVHLDADTEENRQARENGVRSFAQCAQTQGIRLVPHLHSGSLVKGAFHLACSDGGKPASLYGRVQDGEVLVWVGMEAYKFKDTDWLAMLRTATDRRELIFFHQVDAFAEPETPLPEALMSEYIPEERLATLLRVVA